jgi:hypothetical protein
MHFLPKKDLVYALVIWNGPVIFLFFYSQAFLIVFLITLLLSLWIEIAIFTELKMVDYLPNVGF